MLLVCINLLMAGGIAREKSIHLHLLDQSEIEYLYEAEETEDGWAWQGPNPSYIICKKYFGDTQYQWILDL